MAGTVYFSDALRVLFRQLPIVLIGMITVVACAVLAFEVVPTNYQANGQVLLLPPSDPIPEGDPVNPYLNLPGSLTLTASLLAGAVTTPDSQRDMVQSGFPSAYAASVVPQTGPLIMVTVEDSDPAAALATRDEVLRRLAGELDTIQVTEAVPPNQMIVARDFGVSQEAEVLAGSRLRAMAVIVALGTVLTLLAAFAADRWRTRRATRRARVATTGTDGQPSPYNSESEADDPVSNVEDDGWVDNDALTVEDLMNGDPADDTPPLAEESLASEAETDLLTKSAEIGQ